MPKRLSSKPSQVTIEELAGMVKRGFDQTASKEDLKASATKEDLSRIERKVDDGFLRVNERLDQVRRDIADLDDLRERVEALETQMGVIRKK